MIPRVLLVLGAAALVPVLVACADDASGAHESTPAPDTTAAGTATTAAPTTDAPAAGTTPTTDGPATEVPPNGEVVDVLALDNSFRPETIEIEAGTAVRWENRGRNDHNILPADESGDFGVEVDGFAPGDVYEYVFGTPGEYPYYCSLHGTATVGMVGTIVVTD